MTSDKEKKKIRFESIDQFKGILVVLMVIYHATTLLDKNDGFGRAELIRDRLEFLHSAFLFVSGILCGLYYYPKSKTHKGVAARVCLRGVRLLAVFAFCNVVAYLLFRRFDVGNLIESFSSLELVIKNFVNRVSGSLFAFEVLAYIAIYLILASVLLNLYVLIFALPLLFALAIGCGSLTAQFLFVGASGQVIGVLLHKYPDLIKITENKGSLVANLRWCAVLAGYLCLRLFLVNDASLFVPKPILLVSDSLAWWILSPILFCFLPRVLSRAILDLGHYTLMAYLIQMPLIEVVLRLWPRSSAWINYLVFMLLIFLAVVAFVWAVKFLRDRSRFLDACYRKTFA